MGAVMAADTTAPAIIASITRIITATKVITVTIMFRTTAITITSRTTGIITIRAPGAGDTAAMLGGILGVWPPLAQRPPG